MLRYQKTPARWKSEITCPMGLLQDDLASIQMGLKVLIYICKPQATQISTTSKSKTLPNAVWTTVMAPTLGAIPKNLITRKASNLATAMARCTNSRSWRVEMFTVAADRLNSVWFINPPMTAMESTAAWCIIRYVYAPFIKYFVMDWYWFMHSLIMIGSLSTARMFQVEWTAVVLLILSRGA